MKKFTKIIATALAITTFATANAPYANRIFSLPAYAAAAEVDSTAKFKKIMEMYPTGSRWTESYTNGINTSWQCFGWAYLMGYLLTGCDPYSDTLWKKSQDDAAVADLVNYNGISPGDIIRFGTDDFVGHSILVLAVYNNKNILFADCNADGKCTVFFGRQAVLQDKYIYFPPSETELHYGYGMAEILWIKQCPVEFANFEFKTSNLKAKAAIADSKTFDFRYYVDTYDDLKNAFGDNAIALRKHWDSYGMKEGRSPSPRYSYYTYKARYSDLQAAFGNSPASYYNHYINYGLYENRNAARNILSTNNVVKISCSNKFMTLSSNMVTTAKENERAASQKWILQYINSNTLRIVSKNNPSKALTVTPSTPGLYTEYSAIGMQNVSSGSPAQSFTITKVGSKYKICLKSKPSLCLTLTSAGKLCLETYKGKPSQLFTLENA